MTPALTLHPGLPCQPSTLPRDTRIHVSGHSGFVGSAVWRYLQAEGLTDPDGRISAARSVGCTGAVERDAPKQDGNPGTLLDISHIQELGLPAEIGLEGLAATYAWHLYRPTRLRG